MNPGGGYFFRCFSFTVTRTASNSRSIVFVNFSHASHHFCVFQTRFREWAMSSIENESDVDYSETEECGYDDYYNPCDDTDNEVTNQKKWDSEHYEYDCLTVDQVSLC